MNNFEDIRPYHDDEVNSVLIELSNNRRFLNKTVLVVFSKRSAEIGYASQEF